MRQLLTLLVCVAIIGCSNETESRPKSNDQAADQASKQDGSTEETQDEIVNETMFMSSLPDDFQAPAPESEFDKQLIAQIDKVGWYNVQVAGEDESPAFAFTIGHFQNHNHPEIIVLGLPQEVSHQLLNAAAVKIVGAKERIEPFKKYEDLTETLSVVFVPVDFKHYQAYWGYANWYYESMDRPYPALQMVWPDREGLYPWEDGYDEKFTKLQPLLAAGSTDQ